MNITRQTVKCENCGTVVPLSPSVLKDCEYEPHEGCRLILTYTECKTCGEISLKQIDIPSTSEIGLKVARLKLKSRKNKLSDKQKRKLFKLDRQLNADRKVLNNLYWDEAYQFLNK